MRRGRNSPKPKTPIPNPAGQEEPPFLWCMSTPTKGLHSTKAHGQNFPRPSHWPSLSFVHSFTQQFFSVPPACLALGITLDGQDMLPTPRGLSRRKVATQKKSRTQGHRLCDVWMHREGPHQSGHVGGGVNWQEGLLWVTLELSPQG